MVKHDVTKCDNIFIMKCNKSLLQKMAVATKRDICYKMCRCIGRTKVFEGEFNLPK